MQIVVVVIIVLVILAVVFWGVSAYNRLVRQRNRVDNAWAQVDVELKRRYDLIPNIVETVKGYASHERETFESVVAARSAAQQASGVAEQAQAENMLTGALRQLFALAEAYPQLRATENFQGLQTQLTEIEGDIAVARQIFNDTTLTYNNSVQTIPTSVIAGIAGFDVRPFFEVESEGRTVPKVEF